MEFMNLKMKINTCIINVMLCCLLISCYVRLLITCYVCHAISKYCIVLE